MSGTEGLSPDARRLLDALLAERGDPSITEPADGLPLSRAQERLWGLGELAAGTAWGNLPIVFRVHGSPDLDALSAAIGDLIARHETLRTRFERSARGPVGRVLAPSAESLHVESVAGPEEALARIGEEAGRPLDPTREPLFRARWLSAGDRGGWLFLLTHHLVTDGWSLGLLLRELSAGYAARLEGRPPELDPIRMPFSRLVAAERDGPPPEPAALAYWESRLAGAPREIRLPGSAAPGGASDYRSEVRHGALGPEASAALRRVAAERGVTPFGAWSAIVGATLAAASGEPDIVLGTTISDRTSAEREVLVANLGNNLLLRARFDLARSFADALEGIRDTLPSDLAHQAVPLEALLRRVKGLPRLHVLFMLREGSPDDHFELVGHETAYVSVHAGASTLDLTIDVQDLGHEGFAFSVEHRLARVSAAEAARLVHDLTRVAEIVAERPDAMCAELAPERGRWISDDADAKLAADEPVVVSTAELGGDASPPGGDLTPGEAVLVDVWRDALELDHVGPYDNFFELGGHSLLAIDVLERIEERTGVRLTPVDLVSQTLGQLAGAIDEGLADAPGSTAEGNGEGWLGRLRRARGAS